MTHATLENPADLFANVAKTILLADSPAWPFAVYEHREFGAAMANNRVEVTATGFGRASDHMDLANVAGVQTPFYNHHRGTLAFAVVTTRPDQQNIDNHAYCLGRIGYLCSRPAQKFTTSALQNLVVLDIVDQGVTAGEDTKTDRDRTTRTFTLEYIIPAAVYAAAT